MIPVRLTKVFKQFNPGEVAGFDEKTARYLVDNDMGIAQAVDAKGNCTDTKLPATEPAAETPKPADPAPAKGKKGAAAETPKPE